MKCTHRLLSSNFALFFINAIYILFFSFNFRIMIKHFDLFMRDDYDVNYEYNYTSITNF